MGFFGKRRPAKVDNSLPDGQWLAASKDLFDQDIEPFYGSPETMARGGEEHYTHGNYGTAMFFFAKSIDMLHTAYGFSQMTRCRPSPADLAIVEGFTVALVLSLRAHPEAPVADCVREIAHRLRSIATECDRLGLPSDLYRSGLESMAQTAPHVPVDDVLWT